MNIPEGLKYSKEHEWLRVEGDEAYIGITDFAQGELGDIVYVEVETVGDEVAKDEVFGTVEAVKTVSDLYMPLDAEVLELNEKLEEQPELVNEDPYGEGWMIKIKLSDLSQLDDMMDHAAYKDLIV